MPAVTTLVRYRFGRFELQPDQRRLLDSGTPVHLRPHAFDLLLSLVEHAGQLVTKDDLLRRVWDKVVVEENTLQAHISALRKVLGSQAIATVAGHGYRFTQQAIPVGAVESSAATPKHNLPYALTSFIGREKELAELEQLLASARLLTLTGSGGCGKTRLAIQLAKQRAHAYPHGVWLVELAALTDAALAPQTVASVLSIKEKAGAKLLDTVAEFLAPRSLLLVLDNAEHLIDACAQLAESLLQRCARLAILVTSRERLGITGELIYRVPSLSVPDEETDTTPASIAAYESARLLIERARLQRPDFAINTQNSAAIASICRRLDGIALALELAAPRVRTISVEELSRRLDRRFELLTEGSRTALPRHRTLRSLIDWSYDLLGESERIVLERISVFAGGWNLEAAERICCGADVDSGAMPDLLTSLADKNLVVVETRGQQMRFGMLETVRHYAQDRLRDCGDEASVRARHLDYFLAIVDRLDAAERDDDRRAVLDRLDEELDNVRAALAWCETDVALSLTGLRLAGRLYLFWELRGAYSEGRGWIARLLAVASDAEKGETHARAFHTAGTLAYIQADFEQAETYHRQALALGRQLGDRRQVARAIGNLGNVALSLEDYEAARARYAEALAIAREAGDSRNIAYALYSLGLATFQCGDLADAQAFLEESLAIGTKLGSWSASRPQAMLGVIRHLQGDRQAARTLLTEAAAGSRELRDSGLYSRVSGWLALLAHDEGDVAQAAAHTIEALTIQHELDAPVMLGFSLQAAACVASASAGPIGVAHLLGAAQRMRELHRRRHNDFDMSERHERLVATVRSALRDDAVFDLAWNEGGSMTQDEAVRYAMALLK